MHSPDGAPPAEVELAVGQALLVGRAPDPAQCASVAVAPEAPRCLHVPSNMVSGNHLLVWATADGLDALDPGSKNGSFLRVTPGAVTRVIGAASAEVYLAPPRVPSASTGPADVLPLETEPDAFTARIAQAVTAWLVRLGLDAHVVVRGVNPAEGAAPAGVDPDDGARVRLPLVEGFHLELAERGASATEIGWDAIQAELYRYVHDQVARWRACYGVKGGKALAFGSPEGGRTLREVLEAARLRVPLVLRGETGTGKTALAAIYARRSSGDVAGSAGAGGPPFVTLHCAHLDPALAHARLFGALKGSYTSSERAIIGAVKLADGGVLFLDDVDTLPLETQAKLLRFLDEGRYEPLGHGQREPLVAQVRVVAATNVDLRAAVRERRFREDLYWRLHMGAVVRVPPLRERPEDVEALLRTSMGHAPTDSPPASPPVSVKDRLAPDALEFLLSAHPWRGNFRECLRFCTRIQMEPRGVRLGRRRCEAILSEASLEPEVSPPAPVVDESGSLFERAFSVAVRWWLESEGLPPTRFDELGRFCESYLKSIFVAHSLGLAEAGQRPESFEREGRARLACDLTTLKRKVDDYIALRDGRPDGPG